MKRLAWLLTIIVIFTLNCGTTPAAPAAAPPAKPKLDRLHRVECPSLEGNLMGNSSTQRIRVLYPPEEAVGPFPSLYWFHGYGGNYDTFTQNARLVQERMRSGEIPWMVMVLVNGATDQGGSFWVDSPATGNWESMVIQDIIPFVDANYPTIPSPEARGIWGFSMGGYAALNLGLKYPEVFSTVFSLSPGALRPDELELALKTWSGDQGFLEAYAAAFSPLKGEAQGRIPEIDGTEEDLIIQQDWLDGFGNFEQKARVSLQSDFKHKAIKINWGSEDYYTWIPSGSANVLEILKENGFPATGEAFDRGHSFNNEILLTEIMPFFAENLLKVSSQIPAP
jgi:S-formylglutathione hydrolase FrmB